MDDRKGGDFPAFLIFVCEPRGSGASSYKNQPRTEFILVWGSWISV
jgi:hypothetical protein